MARRRVRAVTGRLFAIVHQCAALADSPCQRTISATMNPLHASSSAGAAQITDAEFARKAELCANVLVEARRLARSGWAGPPLNQLVARAAELQDDMNEILAALDPTSSGPGSVIAAALRRELALVRAKAGMDGRDYPPPARTASKR